MKLIKVFKYFLVKLVVILLVIVSIKTYQIYSNSIESIKERVIKNPSCISTNDTLQIKRRNIYKNSPKCYA